MKILKSQLGMSPPGSGVFAVHVFLISGKYFRSLLIACSANTLWVVILPPKTERRGDSPE